MSAPTTTTGLFTGTDTFTATTTLQMWVYQQLPTLNTAIESDTATLEDLLAVLQPLLRDFSAAVEPALPWTSRDQARALLQVLGFCVSAVEKHSQEQHHPPGTGLARLPGIAELLVRLGATAQHPPRDSHYTYWLQNAGPAPFTFTGDPQEVVFNQAVNHTHTLHTLSANALRPLCGGDIDVTRSTAHDALYYAAGNMLTIRQRFLYFMAYLDDVNRRAMEPLFFMTRMRTYLPTYPIGGVVWHGVNAANLAAQIQVDFLIGTVDEDYHYTVADRFRYLTMEDHRAVQDDMALPSLADRILDQLGLTRDTLAALPPTGLAARIAQMPEELRDGIAAYKVLVKAAAQLTATHWMLIQNYLVKASKDLTSAQRDRLPVKPDEGTGKASHEQTRRIMEMRRAHPLVSKLIA